MSKKEWYLCIYSTSAEETTAETATSTPGETEQEQHEKSEIEVQEERAVSLRTDLSFSSIIDTTKDFEAEEGSLEEVCASCIKSTGQMLCTMLPRTNIVATKHYATSCTDVLSQLPLIYSLVVV